jgi:peroxiredoxin
MKKILMSIAALLISAPLAFAAPEIGKPAPDFTAKDTMGKEVNIAALKGKLVVLEWTNPGCPFVKKFYDAGDMQKLQATYTAKDVQWIRVNSSAEGKEGNQTTEGANALAKTQKVSATATILDPKGEIGHLYDAKTTPHMFVIGKDGNIAYMGAIDSIRSTDAADIAKADNYVAQALDALLADKPVKTTSAPAYGCGVKY